MGRTTIQISDDLADELYARKERGDTYADVIRRLIADADADDLDDHPPAVSVLAEHYDADHWKQMPDDAESEFAVLVPEDASLTEAGSYRYLDTLDGVRDRLREWYE
jgi:hypothetical protein